MSSSEIRATEGRRKIYNSVLDTVGNTPVVKINNLAPSDINFYVTSE